jgi:hypothetical protein
MLQCGRLERIFDAADKKIKAKSRWNNPELFNLDQIKSCCMGNFH